MQHTVTDIDVVFIFIFLVPPMFTEPISCTHTQDGDWLLRCQADGNPKAPIVWYKDGQIIQVTPRAFISSCL